MIKKKYFHELSRVYSFIYEKKLQYSISIIITGVANPCIQIMFAFAYKNAVNAIEYNNQSLLGRASLLVIASIIIQCIVEPIANCYNGCLVNHIIRRIREEVFKHVEMLPLSYFENNHSGDIMARLTSDFEKFEPIYRGNARDLMQSMIYGISALVSIFILSYRLAICVILFSAIIFLGNAAFTNSLRIISERNHEQVSKVTQAFINIYNGSSMVKMFHKEEKLKSDFDQENSLLAEVAMITVKMNVKKTTLNYSISFVSKIGMLLLGLFMVSKGNLDIGSVVSIISLQSGVTNMFVSIGGFMASLQENLAAVSRIFQILDTKVEDTRYNVSAAGNLAGDETIVFENVCFSYIHEKNVLDHINLRMKKGNIYTIVGANGSGKSTLLKLLMGFYEPQGNISILGKAYGDYSLAELREQIAYVPQQPVLFSTSIKENIGYGKLDATEEEIVASAKLARIHDYIVSLKDGYDTNVGDKGAFLSGGLRQRIVIARALIKKAPIIILDESTSSLDMENEVNIIDLLKQIAHGRIIIIIAHRLYSIQNLDWIYVMDGGQIREQGKHSQLMEKSALYHRLYDLQLTEEVEDE